MIKQRLQFVPTTTPGRWSVALIVAMPLLFMLGGWFANSLYVGVPAPGTIAADIVARPALALTMLAGMACGIAAFVTGLIAILQKKEHALLVLLSTAVGGLLLIFLAGEFTSPH